MGWEVSPFDSKRIPSPISRLCYQSSPEALDTFPTTGTQHYLRAILFCLYRIQSTVFCTVGVLAPVVMLQIFEHDKSNVPTLIVSTDKAIAYLLRFVTVVWRIYAFQTIFKNVHVLPKLFYRRH